MDENALCSTPELTRSDRADEPEWKVSDEPVPYEDALIFMDRRNAEIQSATSPEAIWLLEHPSLYTAGTSANVSDLLTPERFPVFKTGRGGQYTYHGPGQRIAYAMMDLNKRGKDVRCYVHNLEEWLIKTLARFNVKGERRSDRIGIWVVDKGEEKKIAAIGVRVRRWVTMHGIALNVEPDLEHFEGIVPCGISQYGVTSLVELGIPLSMADVDIALKETFAEVFG
jgi:lipoyl(octanoyl) transferase